MPRSYVVGLRSYLILGAVCCIFFIGCSIGAFLSQQYWPILIFGFFVIMGIYLLARPVAMSFLTAMSHTKMLSDIFACDGKTFVR
jgi:hypothetical protein